jgi:aspartyl-tRNA(Asn)/glutamyl-tRNA(Gln) amidotransferase subunit A
MEYASLDAIRADLASEKITVSALTDFYLTRIGEQADLNAFNEVFTESAREQALAVDRRLASGNAGKLAGLVIGIKDNICKIETSGRNG